MKNFKLKAVFVVLGIIFSTSALASMYTKPYDLSKFTGVSIITYRPERGAPSVYENAIDDLFGKYSQFKVIHRQDFKRSEAFDKSTLFIRFNLDKRDAVSDGKPVKLAALSVDFMRVGPPRPNRSSSDEFTHFTHSHAYPFVYAEGTDELDKGIAEGIKYLLTEIAPDIACVNDPGRAKDPAEAVDLCSRM